MIERVSTLPSSSTPTLIAHRNFSFFANAVQDEPIETTTSLSPPLPQSLKKSKSIYPALIVGLSMVSRGEIGFLIANIGVSTSILSAEAFIVTIWAILLNTILGPIAVGLMVKLLGSKLTDGLWVDLSTRTIAN
ncbi:unnamed protein product [Rotaria sordida]|uniref:Cation/H+ exchanger transmembrane domain-containing protein n=1 Tax=Rotaria sordida TaxID=392033 RepID=A0A819PBK5_9BILA|nr:unnamed protein product [Rotaria sordida]CAF1363209.1 unnamed protein product [Rotaria sordida]CAF4012398.1 unnamed protein product [Rotaria sordida]CAF4092209.1 unnamed protein product [Rotaria sordida]